MRKLSSQVLTAVVATQARTYQVLFQTVFLQQAYMPSDVIASSARLIQIGGVTYGLSALCIKIKSGELAERENVIAYSVAIKQALLL